MLSKASGMRSCGFVATCVAVVFVCAFVQSAIAQDETPASAPATAAGDAASGESSAATGVADVSDTAAGESPAATGAADQAGPHLG